MKFCGREFSEFEILFIRNLINNTPNITRTAISRIFCKEFFWFKQDGLLKEMSCRVALLKMEKAGLIKLPEATGTNGNGKINIKPTCKTDSFDFPYSNVTDISMLKLKIVAGRIESRLWNEYVNRYHYLGYKTLPGAQLRYFIEADEKMIVGLLGFGAAAWKIAPRDNLIGWNDIKRMQNLHLIVNNSRFLIFPWINCKNLASKILSMVTKRLANDWAKRYAYRPLLLETFVEKEKFNGISYKAANWKLIGQTQGRGKLDKKREFSVPVKDIYIYPLSQKYRQLLNL